MIHVQRHINRPSTYIFCCSVITYKKFNLGIMEGGHLHLLLLLVTLIQGIQGQAITPSSEVVAVDDDVSLECRTTTVTNPFLFTWAHITPTGTVTVIYAGGIKEPGDGAYGNFDLDEDTTSKRSTLIINIIQRQDEGQYRCSASGQNDIPLATVTVEVGSKPDDPETESIALTSTGDNSNPMYQATCEAIGSSPAEIITWILDGATQTDGIVDETNPHESDETLFDTISQFTFPATLENYNVTLECNISGHQVAKLNRQITRLVDIHNPPVSTGGIIIGFTSDGEELTVSCDDTNSAAVPAMSTFNIYSNGTLIPKPESDKAVTVPEPEQRTEFRCEGSNYLGDTTTSRTYDPDGTTTLTPTTMAALETTTKNEKTIGSGGRTDPPFDPIPIIIVCVVAVIVIIVIVIAVLFCKNKGLYCFKAGGIKSSGSSKPAGSAVGSSNGSEREKLPQAAPRGHGSIQHTNDNPDQAMYAMVDKKPARGGGGGAGDAPDRGSAPGQNEPPGMLYADLDLSHKAGHTDKHVPKNENDVVVYSSILV